MPKMAPAPTPNVIQTVRSGPAKCSAVDHLQNEAPRNDGDTGVVSAVGTPMLKSDKVLRSKGRGRVLAM